MGDFALFNVIVFSEFGGFCALCQIDRQNLNREGLNVTSTLIFGSAKFALSENSRIKNLLMPLFLRKGCFPGDFQEGKRPIKAFGETAHEGRKTVH